MQKTQLTGGNPTLEAAGVEKGGDIAFARRNVCSNAIGANAKLERSGSGYDRLIHTRPPKIHWRDDVLLVRLSLIFSVMSIEICFFSQILEQCQKIRKQKFMKIFRICKRRDKENMIHFIDTLK